MKILFGVFDWGLGHATRDIPLIKSLLEKKHEIDIISTGGALKILKSEFGNKCRYFDVPSIKMFHKAGKSHASRFFTALPVMLYKLHNSRKSCYKIIKEGKYDKVISDMRLDIYDKKDNSYLIAHHFGFKIYPYTSNFMEAIEKFIESKSWHYKNILVPDFKKNGITGKLGHRLKFVSKDKKISYIGILSRIKKRNLLKDVDYFISISGPEPQRTIFEKKIFEQLKYLKGKVILTLGKPGLNLEKKDGDIEFYGYLNKNKQEEVMNRAKFIICYSGYTTMMEFCELGVKKALIIPQPTLPEQEYLSDFYTKKGYFYHTTLEKLDLRKDVKIARRFKGFKIRWKTKKSVDNFIKIIEK